MEFRKPLHVEGYGLRTADEGLDPQEWSLFATETNSSGRILKKNLMIASRVNHAKRGKWELAQYPLERAVWCSSVTLRVHKSSSHDTAECQIG